MVTVNAVSPVGLVIIGGIKRIGSVAGKLVPMMCLLYLAGALSVLIADAGRIPGVMRLIIASAFAPTEAAGAFLGASAVATVGFSVTYILLAAAVAGATLPYLLRSQHGPATKSR